MLNHRVKVLLLQINRQKQNGNKMELRLLEEEVKEVNWMNFSGRKIFSLTMIINVFMLLIGEMIELWNGNLVPKMEKLLLEKMVGEPY
jgi:hypothetical protein